MNTEQLYVELKPLLFSLAYQMMSSVADAEDIVQDAFLSLQEDKPNDVRFVKAYLCKVVTNKCLNKLKSTSRKREVYVGPWLPEPLFTGGMDAGDPLDRYISKESLSTAYLLLLQQLSVVERVVFLLRELFDYPFQDIAEIVDKSSGNCRQIFYRAKKSIGMRTNMALAPAEIANPMTEQFANAIASGNIQRLLMILSTETKLYMDGGGNVTTALRPIVGQELIVRCFTAIRPKVPGEIVCEVREINGNPGILVKLGELTFSVISFNIKGKAISDIYIVINPEKLAHFNR